ncbi:MAG: hypothetical protein ABW205_12085 [Burkholderiales bacterium]
MKYRTCLIPLAGMLLAGSAALAAEPSDGLVDHPAVIVSRTGAHPSYEDGMKVYGHPARGTSGSPASDEHPLEEHPAVTVYRTGAHPGYEDGMKVYLHPAGGASAAAARTTQN